MIQIVPGDNSTACIGGENITGLGDGACRDGGTTVVRVGDLMLNPSENPSTMDSPAISTG